MMHVIHALNEFFFDVYDDEGNRTATDWQAVVGFYGVIVLGVVVTAVMWALLAA